MDEKIIKEMLEKYPTLTREEIIDMQKSIDKITPEKREEIKKNTALIGEG